MTIDKTRLIGRTEIQNVFEKLYGIATWPGVLKYAKRNNFPLHRTGTRNTEKPMVDINEVIEYELKNGRTISISDIIHS